MNNNIGAKRYLPEEKPEKRRWTDPVVLVPIIVAVITAIVGPTYLLYIQNQNQNNGPSPPTEEITPETPTPQVQTSSLNVSTDKGSYGFGDYVRVTGSVGKPVQGKTARLDVYNSKGEVFQQFNDSVGAYVPQTDIQVRPNDIGQFSYQFPLGLIVLDPVKGLYKVEVAYEGLTKNATFTVR